MSKSADAAIEAMQANFDATNLNDKYRRHRPLIPTGNIKETNKAIEVPNYLFSEDGRRFAIVSWFPVVTVGNVVSVIATFHIEMAEPDANLP